MINPNGNRCKLRVQYSKKEEDHLYIWPLGVQAKSDSMFVSSVISSDFIKQLKERGYDPTTLKFSINIDWSNPRAKDKFKTIWEEIRDSVPKDLNQMSLFPDQPSPGGSITGGEACRTSQS